MPVNQTQATADAIRAQQVDDEMGTNRYSVGDQVRTHQLHGGGVTRSTASDPSMHREYGFEVPVTPGVRLHHVVTVNLGAGTIDPCWPRSLRAQLERQPTAAIEGQVRAGGDGSITS